MKTIRLTKALVIFGVVCSAEAALAVSGVQLQTGLWVLEKGIFNTVFAKELCSCLFVDGLPEKVCQARDNLPAAAHELVVLAIDPQAKTVSSKWRPEINWLQAVGYPVPRPGPAAKAQYVSERFGCRLVEGP